MSLNKNAHLIWRHRCSQTQSLPQVVSGLIVTSLITPLSFGGPIQSLTSLSKEKKRKKLKKLQFLTFRVYVSFLSSTPNPVCLVSLHCLHLESNSLSIFKAFYQVLTIFSPIFHSLVPYFEGKIFLPFPFSFQGIAMEFLISLSVVQWYWNGKDFSVSNSRMETKIVLLLVKKT